MMSSPFIPASLRRRQAGFRLRGLALVLCALVLALCPREGRAAEPFGAWLAAFYEEALRSGISAQTLEEALGDVKPIPRVIELDRKQPEGRMSFRQYYARVISPARIEKGREMLHRHRDLLTRVGNHYGVPPQYIVALWGIETSYGENTGGFQVIPALATLAYDGRRSEFFRGELLSALKIIEAGHIDAAGMKGSWAGAMGQNQFMPSSFHAFAVDGDGDGTRNIWTSLPDVFSSTANYLSKSGWQEDWKWGRAVILPQDFPESLIGLDAGKTLAEWRRTGIKMADGTDLPETAGTKAWIVAPDGLAGPAFLVYDNYRVIMKWNKSTYFATSVGLLADQIAR